MADIQQRKLAEERLLESQEQLLQSQKMEAVGQLAGGIAHDFNNLLGVIMGYNDLALAELGPGGPTEHLGQVKRAAERAATLTKQVLAFSRRQTLRPVVLSLNGIVSTMAPLLKRTLGEDVELVTEVERNLGRVEADRHQLEQVLMNLALNSRDAMPCGGRLTIRTANLKARDRTAPDSRAVEELGREDLVVLSVADTGSGMDAAAREHIFEPFFTTKGSGCGSGLGMSVVYGVVKQSRGTSRSRASAARGPLYIYLPQTQAASAEVETQDGTPTARSVGRRSL